jgi:hypothetical protein
LIAEKTVRGRQETISYSQDTLRHAHGPCGIVIIVNELINIIVQKTGISQENAQKAAQVAVDFFKSKLPAPMRAQLDSFVTGGASGGVKSMVEQADGFLKGKFTEAVSAKA